MRQKKITLNTHFGPSIRVPTRKRGVNSGGGIGAGADDRMLQYAVSKNVTAAPTYTWDAAWPQWTLDGCSPGGYTGGSSGIQVGATIGIPSTVNLPSLGLTADGLAVATALQNYGAMPRATGGTSEFISYAEQAADDSGCCSTQMNNIRDDLRKIMPYFRILRNRRPNSINGGGLREVQSRPA